MYLKVLDRQLTGRISTGSPHHVPYPLNLNPTVPVLPKGDGTSDTAPAAALHFNLRLWQRYHSLGREQDKASGRVGGCTDKTSCRSGIANPLQSRWPFTLEASANGEVRSGVVTSYSTSATI